MESQPLQLDGGSFWMPMAVVPGTGTGRDWGFFKDKHMINAVILYAKRWLFNGIYWDINGDMINGIGYSCGKTMP